MSSITCPQCGTVNPGGARFCRGCGLSLTQRLNQTGALPSAPGGTAGAGGATPTPPLAPVPPNPAQTFQTFVPAPGIGMAPLGPGVTLANGRYAIDRPLGKGGMGSVFLARDTHVNGKPVVIKEMANVYATEEERREAEAEFRAEMTTLAGLSHPNITAITDFFTESNRHFAVQEYVPGQDLQKAIEAAQVPNSPPRGLPEKSVLAWTSQTLSVLDYLEGQNPQVIHRDIKPANIVVDQNNRVKVVDFGIASHKYKPGSTPGAGAQLSTALGTPGYAPREQFTGQETTLSDLYALGATMHHLLTGRDPTKIQPLWQYPPVRTLSPKVSEATQAIVAHAVQNDEKKRYQSAALMKKDVDRVLNPPGALSTARGRAIALLVLLLLLTGAGVGAYVYTSQQQQRNLPATGYLSGGGIAYDTSINGRNQTANDSSGWATTKQQASIAWKNGDRNTAVTDYGKAVANDPTDAESHIYLANARAEASKNAYYMAVGGTFSGNTPFSGRELLQGAYTAQRDINTRGGINGHPLALLLADDRGTTDGAAQSARTIAAFKGPQGQRALALVGYRTSPSTAAALPILAAANIPLVTPTASDPGLNTSPYFFRVCPDDKSQAAQAVRYMLNNLVAEGHFNARVAVFSDAGDSYSHELGDAIGAAVRNLGGSVLAEPYKVGARDFTGQARDLVNRRADVIYVAGYAPEALRLARALDEIGAPQSLSIMTDQEFYNPGEFVNQPGHKGRFHFTAFYYNDQYNRVTIPTAAKRIQAMQADYRTNFYRADIPPGSYGSDRVVAGSALAYDAVQVVGEALDAAAASMPASTTPAAGGSVQEPAGAAVRDSLASIGASGGLLAYQGVTGPIAFDPSGNPINKTIDILYLDADGHTHMNSFLMDGWLGQY